VDACRTVVVPSGQDYDPRQVATEARAFWNDVFTVETWNEAVAHGLTTSGFRKIRLKIAKRVRVGDVLICYLHGHSRFIGALEVTGEAYYAEEPRIWKVDAFPVRLNVRPIVTVEPAAGVSVKSVIDRLHMLEGKDKSNWGAFFQGSPRAMPAVDGQLILSELQDAVRSPRVVQMKPISETAVAQESSAAAATTDDRPAVRQHVEVQAELLKLGRSLGLQPWVARGDRGHLYEEGHTLADLSVKELPPLFASAAQRIIESIDVLWLKEGSPIAAFEVEHTTDVYSGLLRMADLITVQPFIHIRLFIVAPAAREPKVKRELLRPTFARLPIPLGELCGYISFERLHATIEKTSEFAGSLKVTEFLDKLGPTYHKALEAAYPDIAG
jgi:hypothetical protein